MLANVINRFEAESSRHQNRIEKDTQKYEIRQREQKTRMNERNDKTGMISLTASPTMCGILGTSPFHRSLTLLSSAVRDSL